jgi:hypothetical protein
MINGKQFKMVTDKFMSSPTVQNARVQVCLPNGEFYDIKGIQLMENKLIGVRETHKLSPSLLASRIFMRAIKSRSLLLAAWRLMLVARSLMLAACCLNRLVLDACCLRLEAWCLWLAARSLHTLQSLWCYIDGGPLYLQSHLWPERCA